jgi:hypothetical protein
VLWKSRSRARRTSAARPVAAGGARSRGCGACRIIQPGTGHHCTVFNFCTDSAAYSVFTWRFRLGAGSNGREPRTFSAIG